MIEEPVLPPQQTVFIFFGNCLISFTELVFDGKQSRSKESFLLPTSPTSAGASGFFFLHTVLWV